MVDLMASEWLTSNGDRQPTRHSGYTKTLDKQLGRQHVYFICVGKNHLLVVFETSNLSGFLGITVAMKQSNHGIMVLRSVFRVGSARSATTLTWHW